MHPDLPKLLDVQSKDRRLAELRARERELMEELGKLDAALAQVRGEHESAVRAAQDAARRRDEAAGTLEHQRTQHERRRQRLDQERNPRVAAQLLADVELGRNVLAQEESDWVRMSDETIQREAAVGAAQSRVQQAEQEQAGLRAEWQSRRDALEGELQHARAEREESASHLDRQLRTRYDRLRQSRDSEILVPADKGTCTACFTSIPRSRIGKLQADGVLLEGCEMCGAIVYLAEATS